MSKQPDSEQSLQIPNFKPNIPEYMLDSCERQADRYLIEQISVMTQQNSWQTHKLTDIYDYTKSINGKVIELEQFRNDLIAEMKVEEGIEREKQKHTKAYRWSILVFLSLVYPVYLAVASNTGLYDVVKRLLFVVN